MKTLIFFLLISVLVYSENTTYSIPVSSDCHDKLSLALQNLSSQLQYFGTTKQNKNNLYRKVLISQQYLSDLKQQMGQYNNVIIGQNNTVNGSKNIIVGSYNTITGSNNFVFVQQYTGVANGDLLLEQWRINLKKTDLILVDPSLAITFLNEQQNRDYLTLMTNNRVSFGYGSNLDSYDVFKFIRENDPITTNSILNSPSQSQSNNNQASSQTNNNLNGYSGSTQTNNGQSTVSTTASNIANNYVPIQSSTSNANYGSASSYNQGNTLPSNPSSSSSSSSSYQQGITQGIQHYSSTGSNTVGTTSSSANTNPSQNSVQYNPSSTQNTVSSNPSSGQNIASYPVPTSLEQFNALFGQSYGIPQMIIPNQIPTTNYNKGNTPGSIVANQVFTSLNKGNQNSYGNLRMN